MASIIRFLTLSSLLAGSLSITLFAQTSTVIPDTEAEKHIGQDVTVEGIVTAVTTSRKGNTFINFGGVYPNQTSDLVPLRLDWVTQPGQGSPSADTSAYCQARARLDETGRG